MADRDTIFVIGNEAADCDSIVSALVYAWMCGAKAVPVVNNRRAIVELRGEVRVALSFVGLDLADLIYFEDIKDLWSPLKVFLVDHNEPSAQWSRMGFAYEVVGIIDHHPDGHLFTDCRPRVVRECASCVSLVVNEFVEIPQELCKMLLTVLVFDTVNWTWRVTDFDVLAAERLLQRKVDREMLRESECRDIFRQIGLQCIDEASVDPAILLRKDLKLYQQTILYGISVLHTDLLGIHDLESVVRGLMAAEGLQLHIVLSLLRTPDNCGYSQQLAIAATDHARYIGIADRLRGPLQLVPRRESDAFGVFQQLNLEVARKKLQPMLRDMLK